MLNFYIKCKTWNSRRSYIFRLVRKFYSIDATICYTVDEIGGEREFWKNSEKRKKKKIENSLDAIVIDIKEFFVELRGSADQPVENCASMFASGYATAAATESRPILLPMHAELVLGATWIFTLLIPTVGPGDSRSLTSSKIDDLSPNSLRSLSLVFADEPCTPEPHFSFDGRTICQESFQLRSRIITLIHDSCVLSRRRGCREKLFPSRVNVSFSRERVRLLTTGDTVSLNF